LQKLGECAASFLKENLARGEIQNFESGHCFMNTPGLR